MFPVRYGTPARLYHPERYHPDFGGWGRVVRPQRQDPRMPTRGTDVALVEWPAPSAAGAPRRRWCEVDDLVTDPRAPAEPPVTWPVVDMLATARSVITQRTAGLYRYRPSLRGELAASILDALLEHPVLLAALAEHARTRGGRHE